MVLKLAVSLLNEITNADNKNPHPAFANSIDTWAPLLVLACLGFEKSLGGDFFIIKQFLKFNTVRRRLTHGSKNFITLPYTFRI